MLDRAELLNLLSDDLAIGDGDFPTSDDSIVNVAKKSLASSLLKKWAPSDLTPAMMRTGEETFLSYNKRCMEWALPTLNDIEATVLGEFEKNLYEFLHPDGEPIDILAAISEHGGVGPGANIGAKSYNFYTKLFDSQLTMTNDHLLRLYRCAISKNETWASAERRRHESYGEKIVGGSCLFHVLKDSERSRTAATEPTLNMFFQKGIGAVLETRLDQVFSIRLDRQPEVNRFLARIGSVDGTYCTIDLKSASDCIAVLMCARYMPRYFFSWLMLTRSPETILPDGSRVKLQLMSSMGNGFTFPLQTALFACLVKACYTVKDVNLLRSRTKPLNFGVFGDDIVVHRDVYNLIVRMLEILGFVVNENKSFNNGLFRESCGGDYWAGTDVRGVYLKSLATVPDIYSAINRLVRWSRRWVPLTKLIRRLLEELPFAARQMFVPLHEADDAGIKVPLAFATERGKIKWDKRRQSWYYNCLAIKSFQVKFRQPISDAELVDSGNLGLRYCPDKLIRRIKDWRGSEKVDRVGYNPDGLLITILGGFLRNGMLTLRQLRNKHEVIHRYTSFWDSKVDAGIFSLDGDWQVIADCLLT